MLGRIKYLASHLPLIMVAKMGQFTQNLTVRYVSYLGSNGLLMVALCLGLYSRWMLSQEMAVLVVAFLGMFVFAISCALVYYFGMENMGWSLAHVWLGCLMGVVAFTETSVTEEIITEQILNGLLMASLALRWFWIISERLLRASPPQPKLLDSLECLEMIGMATATLLMDREAIAISLFIAALALTIVAIRLKSYPGLLNLLVLIIITSAVYFPKILIMKVNPYALCCFLGRLSFEPVLDVFFLRLSTLERWHPFLDLRQIFRRLLILLLVILDITYFVILAKQMPRHKEWYIVVPIFGAFAFVWWCFHIVFIITTWQLMTKITDCNDTYRSMAEDNRNMKRIMAAKGVRHFSLIAHRLSILTLVTTVILSAIGWETKTGVSLGLMLMVVPMEAAVQSLLRSLSCVLGGTCTGYAIVAPAANFRPNGAATLLHTSAIQELSNCATVILNNIQHFFTHHLINTYGCDYSSSGLTAESIESKLRSFFQRQTSDGPRFDTYLVYYSGHVYENGDWALAGEGTLKFDTLLSWWTEYNGDSGARLILVLDTYHSYNWLREVRHLSYDIVAIQTCQVSAKRDPEDGEKVNIGDFTADWVMHNCTAESPIDWKNSERPIRALFGISRRWTDFKFHLPTSQDIESHWDASFPRMTRPLIKVTNLPGLGESTLWCLDPVLRCLRRKRLMWFLPKELDTGHGFSLIRS